MSKIKITIILLCFVLICFAKKAEAQNPIISLNASAENSSQGSSFFEALRQKNYSFNLITGSTTGVNIIAAMIGSSEGSNDIYYREFDFGEQGDFDDGTSYQANGSTLGLGEHRSAAALYAEVFAIYNDTVRSGGGGWKFSNQLSVFGNQ